MAEKVGNAVARPVFSGGVVAFVVLWILANVGARRLGIAAFDPAPFFWLPGIVSLLALLTTTVVLIRQERLASLEERREHLDLQVNLLTEQKATKLINLFEELRRDLPMVKDRRDPESEAMQQPTDPHRVLAGIDEAVVASVPAGPTEEVKPLTVIGGRPRRWRLSLWATPRLGSGALRQPTRSSSSFRMPGACCAGGMTSFL